MITQIASTTHEAVYQVSDSASGLEGFIALHSTQLGPAAGGLRMREYENAHQALEDVLNLSRGMTFKNAAAGLPLGGGKAVIMGNPTTDKTPEMLHAMGRAIEMLEGRYWTAEDMGMSPSDMAELARETRFVAGLDTGRHASGDPSPITAKGVYNAIRIGLAHSSGSDELRETTVSVQGLGHVGWHLCHMLHMAGAHLIVADMDAARVNSATERFGARAVDPKTIHACQATVFAPCAIGGILNASSIPDMRVDMVCGAANNQLATQADADRLHESGILYLPDYVANGGGIINVAAEILKVEDRDPWVGQKLETLRQTMTRILDKAAEQNTSPAHVADQTVNELIFKIAV